MTHMLHDDTLDCMDAVVDIRVDPQITAADRSVDIDEVTAFHGIEAGAPGGGGVTVAVMDSGVDESHPVFDGRGVTVDHVDFTGRGEGDEVGHGTAVAGLIAQIAPEIDRIVSLRIFGKSGRGGLGPIGKAYRWLLGNQDRVDLVNMSWGATQRISQLDSLQNRLVQSGVRDVTAAGNTGERGGSPATAERAWGVGALTPTGDVTRFSSYNPQRDNPDTSALGKNVKLARASGTSMGRVVDSLWTVASGTSFAAPIQTGMAAAWASRGEEARAIDAMGVFEATADDVPGTPEDGQGRAVLTSALGYDGTGARIDATVWSLLGGPDWMQLDADLFTDGEYTANPAMLREALEKK